MATIEPIKYSEIYFPEAANGKLLIEKLIVGLELIFYCRFYCQFQLLAGCCLPSELPNFHYGVFGTSLVIQKAPFGR